MQLEFQKEKGEIMGQKKYRQKNNAWGGGSRW